MKKIKKTKRLGASESSYRFNSLLQEISARTDIPLYKVRIVLESFVDVVKEKLYEKKSISIPRLGVFYLRLLRGRLYNIVLGYKDVEKRKKTFIYKPDRLSPNFKFTGAFVDQIMKATALQLERPLGMDLEDLMDEGPIDNED